MFGKKKKGDADKASPKKPEPKKKGRVKAKKEKPAKKQKPKKERKPKAPKVKKQRGPSQGIGQQMDVFTALLGISLLAVTVSCLLLFLELSRYGSFPWWKV